MNPAGSDTELCTRCHRIDRCEPGRPVTAGCVHEHFSTLTLCPTHEAIARSLDLWCVTCEDAGHPKVLVTITTRPLGAPDA